MSASGFYYRRADELLAVTRDVDTETLALTIAEAQVYATLAVADAVAELVTLLDLQGGDRS